MVFVSFYNKICPTDNNMEVLGEFSCRELNFVEFYLGQDERLVNNFILKSQSSNTSSYHSITRCLYMFTVHDF